MTRCIVKRSSTIGAADDFFDEINSLFSHFFPDIYLTTFSQSFDGIPVSNLQVKNDGTLRYEIAATSFDPSELDVRIEDGCVIIEGKKEEKKEESEWRYVTHKLVTKNFRKAFSVPKQADLDNIKAEVKNGMITLTIPLKQKEVRKIELKSDE